MSYKIKVILEQSIKVWKGSRGIGIESLYLPACGDRWVDGWMDGFALGSSPYSPDATRPACSELMYWITKMWLINAHTLLEWQ